MQIWQAHLTTEDRGCSAGYRYAGTEQQLRAWLAENGYPATEPVEALELGVISKKAVIAFLNRYASHPDNG